MNADYHRSRPAWWPLVTYVTNVKTASGVLDELELDVVPVLPGPGRERFDGLDPEHIELERVRVVEGEHGVTHLRSRVCHGA